MVYYEKVLYPNNVVHDGKARWATDEHTTAFLDSGWL